MSAILRRAEYKRRRKYKARARKRHPIDRFMREMMLDVYTQFRQSIFPMVTTLRTLPQRTTGPVRNDDYAGHLAEEAVHLDGTEAVSVNYGVSGRVPSSAAKWGGNSVQFDVVRRS